MSAVNHAPDDGHDETIRDVLGSIRRILQQDAPLSGPSHDEAEGEFNERKHAMSLHDDLDEITLDKSMMVSPPLTTSAAPSPDAPAANAGMDRTAQPQDGLMNPRTAAAAEHSLSELQAAFAPGRAVIASETVVSARSGLTIEDMVQAEVRSMVRAWLDAHLPSMVEILVRAEIARLRPNG